MSQFIIPESHKPETVPYSKESFQKDEINLRDVLIATKRDFVANPKYSKDLLSNLVDEATKKTFVEAKGLQKVAKDFSFAAAHNLPYHKGKCRYLHGHEWKLRVEIEAPVNAEGMIMDFSNLKERVNGTVIEMMDHAYINAILYNPTAENLCVYIWNVLQYVAELKSISKITIWETPTSEASIDAEAMSLRVEGMWEWK